MNIPAIPSQLRSRRSALGFTLVELMIAVGIVAILAAIAYPSYQNHVRKGNRAAAKAFLMDVVQRQQQYFLDAREFADTLVKLNTDVPAEVSRNYEAPVIVITSPPPKVTVSLAAKGDQVADGNLSLSSTGEKVGNW